MYIIELKQAVENAIKYFEELNQFNSSSITISNVLLEEVAKKNYQDTKDCWYITLGYNEQFKKEKKEGPFTNILADTFSSRRKYKTIIIDPEGNFKAMEVRDVEYA